MSVVDADVLVVGAGAIGGITAALMQGEVRRVMVLDADEEHVAALRDPGLRLERLGEASRVKLDAYADADDLPARADFALVTLKAAYLEPALAPLRDRADTFVSLGNGLVQDRVADLVGAERLLIGTVEWGATNLGPGHLAKTTEAPFVIGEPDGSQSERVRRLAEVLGTVTDVHVSGNISGQVWSKLLINSTWSGLGAASGLLYGEIAEHRVGRRVALAIWREGFAVGRAQGLELHEQVGVRAEDMASDDEATADRAVETMMAKLAATKASMLQDLERGVPCEVDVINGAVVERGREHGVPTPLNAKLVELVHGYESGEGAPSPEALELLGAALADRDHG